MKHLFTLIFTLMGLPLGLMAQGWPANYGGVMLQGFYWDSYSDTQWTNLTSQADELSKYFNLIWVPQSGCTSTWYYKKGNTMGYDPCFWLNQNSCFGTETELRTIINTYKNKGTGIIADVVINHKNGLTSWADFPQEDVNGTNTKKEYKLVWDNKLYTQICCNDEANTNEDSPVKGKIYGSPDTGDNFDGYRDLDHTDDITQQNVKVYLDYLKNEIGYAGFRYDMVKGYAAEYTKMYNESAQPTYSVGECWDGLSTIKNWIDNTGKTSAAFDFPFKYMVNTAFNNGGTRWKTLANYTSSTLIGTGYAKYAVTFIDNHDTYRKKDDILRNNVEAANAYLLTMPGTPCVFLPHYQAFRKAIKKFVLTRKLAGITSESTVSLNSGEKNGYSVAVKGNNGSVLLCLGTTTTPTSGYQLVTSGENYKLYISSNIDIKDIKAIDDEKEVVKTDLPECAKVESDATYYAFFEKPSNWGADIYVWAWQDSGKNLYSVWPGSKEEVKMVGTNSKTGNSVYLWKYTGTTTVKVNKIIFNDGSSQTINFDFRNGNYYTFQRVVGNVIDNATGISHIKANAQGGDSWYTMSGTRMASKPTQKGVYIHQGKKAVVK